MAAGAYDVCVCGERKRGSADNLAGQRFFKCVHNFCSAWSCDFLSRSALLLDLIRRILKIFLK